MERERLQGLLRAGEHADLNPARISSCMRCCALTSQDFVSLEPARHQHILGCASMRRTGLPSGRRGPCSPGKNRNCKVTTKFFHGMQVGIPKPPIMELSVRGAKNTFTNNSANSGDTEMALDMQVRRAAPSRLYAFLW